MQKRIFTPQKSKCGSQLSYRQLHTAARVQGEAAVPVGSLGGQSFREVDAVCIRCLQTLAAKTIKIWKFRTIHLLILDQHVSRWELSHIWGGDWAPLAHIWRRYCWYSSSSHYMTHVRCSHKLCVNSNCECSKLMLFSYGTNVKPDETRPNIWQSRLLFWLEYRYHQLAWIMQITWRVW